MELRAGYKKIEGRIIPNDWDMYTVNDLITFEGGSQPDKSTFVFSARNGYVRLIQIRDYKSDKYETYVPTNLARKFCAQDDIMIGRYGPPIFQILKGIEGAYNVALIKATPKSKLSNLYAYFFLKQDSLFSFVEKLSQRSSGQTGIDLNELKGYPFPLPKSYAEQIAIANALSDADALIGSLQKLIAKKRQIKQGMMHLFLTGKRRLPGFENALGTKKTNYGEIPTDWHIKPLPEVMDFFHGKAHERFISESGKYEVVNSKFVSTDGHVKKYSNVNFAEAKIGDILMVLSDLPNGRALAKCFYVDAKEKYAVNQRVCIFRAKNNDPKFLFYILNRNPYFLSLDDGVTQTHILNNDLKNCQLIIPSKIEEQASIAKAISDMDEEIVVIETMLRKYQQIKQGMMQNLLTGRMRLV